MPYTGNVEEAMSETDALPRGRRGEMIRRNRQLPDAEAREFLRSQRVAHVGTVDADGWPYVIPLVFIYEGGDILYLHTGALNGQFQSNMERDGRLCLEVCDMGPLHKGKTFACDSALVYTSAVVFGRARILPDREKKAWFFDRLLEKYGDPQWSFETGYPALDRIVLYEMQIEILTGKRSEGLRH